MKYLIILLPFLISCANNPTDPNRVGCYNLDGQARYGTFTQYIKGHARGVMLYIGDNLKGKVDVTCNTQVQQIIYNEEIPEDIPGWIEE